MRANQRYPDPEWFAHVREGDVLEFRGALRVVRSASRRPDGTLWGVSFAKRARSWHPSPTTVYTASELRSSRARYVGARVKLASEVDARIRAACARPGLPWIITQDETVGLP